jgi:hypothetical protein
LDLHESGIIGKPLKRTSTAICSYFFIFDLEYLKRLSHFMQKLIQPPACPDHALHRILSSYWLAHFYLMKKSAKELLYFCLDCGMMKFCTFKPQPKKTFDISPAFMEYGLAKKIEV